jgi:hypothetical protein
MLQLHDVVEVAAERLYTGPKGTKVLDLKRAQRIPLNGANKEALTYFAYSFYLDVAVQRLRRMARSLASSRELGLSPMLQRLLSMRQEIDHETVDAVRGCAR